MRIVAGDAFLSTSKTLKVSNRKVYLVKIKTCVQASRVMLDR